MSERKPANYAYAKTDPRRLGVEGSPAPALEHEPGNAPMLKAPTEPEDLGLKEFEAGKRGEKKETNLLDRLEESKK